LADIDEAPERRRDILESFRELEGRESQPEFLPTSIRGDRFGLLVQEMSGNGSSGEEAFVRLLELNRNDVPDRALKPLIGLAKTPISLNKQTRERVRRLLLKFKPQDEEILWELALFLYNPNAELQNLAIDVLSVTDINSYRVVEAMVLALSVRGNNRSSLRHKIEAVLSLRNSDDGPAARLDYAILPLVTLLRSTSFGVRKHALNILGRIPTGYFERLPAVTKSSILRKLKGAIFSTKMIPGREDRIAAAIFLARLSPPQTIQLRLLKGLRHSTRSVRDACTQFFMHLRPEYFDRKTIELMAGLLDEPDFEFAAARILLALNIEEKTLQAKLLPYKKIVCQMELRARRN
jgi:hypothetical protein